MLSRLKEHVLDEAQHRRHKTSDRTQQRTEISDCTRTNE